MSDTGSGGFGARLDSVRDWADRTQQRHAVLGFPFAVVKKYGEDAGGRHAALITYYGFLSVFPVLLLVVVALTRILSGDDELRARIIDAIVPEQFRETVDAALLTLPTGGVAFVIGIASLLLAGLGVVTSAYQTLNHIAGVPHRKRLDLVPRYLRVVATLLVMLVVVAGVGALAVVVGTLPDLGSLTRLAAFAGTTALMFALLWVATELLLPHRARLSIIWPAALAGSVVISGVLTFGALVLPRLVGRSGPVYGSFATIVGLFSLLFLVSQALVYAAEVAIVRHRTLWPRGLDAANPTPADRRALLLLAREQERLPGERISASFET